MAKKADIKIGTSGWEYKHWQKIFYPKDLPAEKRFSFYAQKFKTVEINNTFYNLPEKRVFKEWKKSAPENFVFSVKASRYITHMKKLKDPKEPVKNFFSSAEFLEEKLGPVLFQLPPYWKANAERLENFFKVLPSGHKYVFEFRDKSWYSGEVLNLLEKNNAALCVHDHSQGASLQVLTADFAYFRFHGPNGRYRGRYTKNQLKKAAEKIIEYSKKAANIYCYFNNDAKGHALQNAQELDELLKS